MTYQIHVGDCIEAMRAMPDNSVDAIVTDPPYGLSFMGKKWDYDVPAVEVWAECLRVLKPGGHLLAFAGTRTQHRMATRIEDAGFEIRDMIAWVYSSGFPKSHNIDNHRGKHVCGCAVPYTHAKTQSDSARAGGQRAGVGVEDCAQAECDVRPVLGAYVPQAESVGKECREVLQPSLQEQGPSIAGREQLPAPE